MPYRFGGKSKLLSFGSYPAVTLKMARDRETRPSRSWPEGLTQASTKKTDKRLSAALTENTFEVVGREWHAKNRDMWEEKRAKAVLSHLEKNLFPFIGKMPIAGVKAPDLLAVARQLAHGDRDNFRASYNFAEFLPERRNMMQAWADYLTELRKNT